MCACLLVQVATDYLLAAACCQLASYMAGGGAPLRLATSVVNTQVRRVLLFVSALPRAFPSAPSSCRADGSVLTGSITADPAQVAPEIHSRVVKAMSAKTNSAQLEKERRVKALAVQNPLQKHYSLH